MPYVEEYTVSVERELSRHLTMSFMYTGNVGHRLLVIQEANPGDPALCLSLPGCGPGTESGLYTTANGALVNGTRGPLGPNFGSDANQTTIGHSSYNAGEINLRYTSRRLELIGAYTYAKSLESIAQCGRRGQSI